MGQRLVKTLLAKEPGADCCCTSLYFCGSSLKSCKIMASSALCPANAGSQPDWLGDLAQSGVPGAAYQAYAAHEKDGSSIYVAYNPYEGPVPAILPDPPVG